MHINPP